MMATDQRNQLAHRLFELEAQLRELNLWDSARPSAQALASTQPFAVDTLSFNQWLQFIFIEKMEVLLQQGLPLPASCELFPMAEESFNSLNIEAKRLLEIIQQIDDLFKLN